DEAALIRAAVEVVAESKAPHGLIRWSAFFRTPEPDLLPSDGSAHIAVAAQPFREPPPRRPIRIAVFPDARKAAPDVLPPNAKVAAAYVGPMLFRKRAIAAGADDVVLLDHEGDIAEAPIANVFAIASDTLWTPPPDRILAGVTRDTVLFIA